MKGAEFISAIVVWCLSTTAFGQNNTTTLSKDEIVQLPAVTLAEPRSGYFYLALNTRPPTKMSFRTIGPSTAKIYERFRFRGRGIRSGDEIVRISGKLVSEMTSEECIRAISAPFRKSSPIAGVEAEVRSKGEKTVRKVTVVQVPSVEVVAPKNTVQVLKPIPPLVASPRETPAVDDTR